jgi:hypothetical protein
MVHDRITDADIADSHIAKDGLIEEGFDTPHVLSNMRSPNRNRNLLAADMPPSHNAVINNNHA